VNLETLARDVFGRAFSRLDDAASVAMRLAVRAPTSIVMSPLSSLTMIWHPGALKREASLRTQRRGRFVPAREKIWNGSSILQKISTRSGMLPTF
jgi:hypothetical protein